jgi:penicillin-binding protein 1A
VSSQEDSAGDTTGPEKPRPSLRTRILRAVAILAGVLVLLLGGGAAWAFTLPMPKPHPTPQATLVYGANGQVIGQFSEQDRVSVPLSEVPQVVIDAVVSTEDRHFFSEGAINPVSTARAFVSDVSGSGGLQGGSTITQQYVKEAYLTPKRTLTRKVEEAVIAFRVGQSQSKRKILEEYLNTIYWGRGSYGIEAAAQAFFGKNVTQLGLPEASLLAAIIKDPGGADPFTDPSRARRYQAGTLKSMVRDHKISPAQADAVLARPYSTYVIPPTGTGSAASAATGADYFLAAVREQMYAAYGRERVDGGGLRVYTTLEPALQTEAYNSVYGLSPGALNPAKGDPSGALVTVDDQGHVLALVGGQNYKSSSVDLALGAAGGGTGRQAGSTFKAIMLAALLQLGYSVNSVLPAPPQITIPDGTSAGTWHVTNYDGEAPAPMMNVVDATALSVNTVYAQIVQRLGADKLDAMAEAMGIPKSVFPHAYLSQVLGTADVSPLEMASAFGTLASGGTYHSPVLITKVTTATGKVLGTPQHQTSHRVLTPAQAAVEDYVLEQVVARGTGTAAGGIGSAVAGKTGTTENSGDAWFIGYTPKVTTALWMGYADNTRSMDGFRGLASVTGGSVPAQLWHQYMTAAVKTHPEFAGPFPPPGDLAGKNLLLPPPPNTTTTQATTTTSSTTTAPSSVPVPPPTPAPHPQPTTPPTTPTTPPSQPSPQPTVPSSTTTTSTTAPTGGAAAGPGSGGASPSPG